MDNVGEEVCFLQLLDKIGKKFIEVGSIDDKQTNDILVEILNSKIIFTGRLCVVIPDGTKREKIEDFNRQFEVLEIIYIVDYKGGVLVEQLNSLEFGCLFNKVDEMETMRVFLDLGVFVFLSKDKEVIEKINASF